MSRGRGANDHFSGLFLSTHGNNLWFLLFSSQIQQGQRKDSNGHRMLTHSNIADLTARVCKRQQTLTNNDCVERQFCITRPPSTLSYLSNCYLQIMQILT